MRILVRLPNWLGDVVMSAGALDLLHRRYPGARVDAVVKDGLQGVARLLPQIEHLHILRPGLDRGLRGTLRFASDHLGSRGYELYLCLPTSFSSAWLGFVSRIAWRRGFRGELRTALLTDPITRTRGLHRVEEYAALVPGAAEDAPLEVRLSRPDQELPPEFSMRAGRHRVLLNIHSEAASRRLPLELGVRIGSELLAASDLELVLTGTPKEKPRAAALADALGGGPRVRDWTGRTDLTVLAGTVADADLVVSTDSGLAHLANALGTPGVVFFGAGNPDNTAPYLEELRTLVRNPDLPCVPCVSNRCRLADAPPCMETIPPAAVVTAALARLGGR